MLPSDADEQLVWLQEIAGTLAAILALLEKIEKNQPPLHFEP